ncbi:hypothetical protein GCM10027563_08430 [Parasphingorhabdus pacifica]
MAEAGFLTDVQVLVQLKGQRRGLGEDLQLRSRHLDLAGADLEVLVALGPLYDLADDADAELRAKPVRALGNLALAEDDLCDAGRIAEIDEDHSSVIAAARHPPCQGDGLPGMTGAKRSGLVRAHHGY